MTTLRYDELRPQDDELRPLKLTLYTKADADEFVRLCDLVGVTPVCTVLQADPVGRPEAYLWHFEIEEI